MGLASGGMLHALWRSASLLFVESSGFEYVCCRSATIAV